MKVESLVQEFLSAQSLRVLPQGPFGDAVTQFVAKDDKHAMELFVSEHLTGQVRQMLGLESDDEDLNSAMEIYRNRIEQEQASAPRTTQNERKRILKPKPAAWDSDFDGNWEEEPDAWTYEDGNMAVQEDEEPAKPKRAPRAKAAPKKAPARRGKKAVESEEEDVVMESDEPAPPPKTRRAPAKAKAAPKTTAKTAKAPAKPATRATRTRQTKLDFSQSQAAVEISDDEISEDDAFEPAPTTRSRRR